MDTLFLEIAGFIIGIKFYPTEPPFLKEKGFKDRLAFYFYGFVTKGAKKADFWIDVKERKNLEMMIQTISKKHFLNIYEEDKGVLTTFYHLSEVQFSLIIRKVCQQLLSKYQGLIIHASASLVKNQAFIFLGSSGAGKSTIINLVSKVFPALADDSVIIKKEGSQYYFYQTPFREKSFWVIKGSGKFKLGKILFLKKDLKQRVIKLKDKEEISKQILEQFLTQEINPNAQIESLLKFISSFDNFYNLHFNLKNPQELVKLLRENEI